MEKIPDNVYDEYEVEATKYIKSLFKGPLKQEMYSLKFAEEMAKTAFIAGKVTQQLLDKNKV